MSQEVDYKELYESAQFNIAQLLKQLRHWNEKADRLQVLLTDHQRSVQELEETCAKMKDLGQAMKRISDSYAMKVMMEG